jgi:hypothetical protein
LKYPEAKEDRSITKCPFTGQDYADCWADKYITVLENSLTQIKNEMNQIQKMIDTYYQTYNI